MKTWHTNPRRALKGGFGEMDPYVDWAFDPDRQAPSKFQSTDRFPILLCLKGKEKDKEKENNTVSVAAFASGEFFPDGARPGDWSSMVRVPPVYLSGDQLGKAGYFTALVTGKFFQLFQGVGPTAVALSETIRNMAVSRNLLEETFLSDDVDMLGPTLPPPSGSSEPGTVVFGIIDDGLAFANERFRTAQGRSRVEHLWLQDGTYNAAAARYGYGRSLSKRGAGGIDELLKSATHAGLIDEDEVYVRARAVDLAASPALPFRPTALHASHGTHVMDLACGYHPGKAPKRSTMTGEEAGVRVAAVDGPVGETRECPTMKGEDARPIVCVQLPAATREGTSGASLDTFAIDGLRYILDKADEIARDRGCDRLPVVVNFSYGTIAGGHTGTSDIELAIDELIKARRDTAAPLHVVVPAGNSRLRKCHARIELKDFKEEVTETGSRSIVRLFWRVIPDDRTTSHLEVWLPRSRGDKSHQADRAAAWW